MGENEINQASLDQDVKEALNIFMQEMHIDKL